MQDETYTSIVKAFITAIITIIGLLILVFVVTQVHAKTEVCFCHNVNHNPHTICTDNQGKINGHNSHVNNGEDTAGACVAPTATPTPTVIVEEPTATPTPIIVVDEPTVTPTPEVDEVTPTPTQQPRVTPTPEEKVQVSSSREESVSSSTGTPSCGDLSVPEVPQAWLQPDAEGNGVLIPRWGTNQYGKVDIRWSPDTSDMNRYSLLNTNNNGVEEIGALDNGTHYWFQVRFRNGCQTGEWSNMVDPLP